MNDKLDDAVDIVIVPRVGDIGDFEVRRVLPFAKRRMVGPFIFLDEFGPVTLPAGKGLDVRPHPHIGLATTSYLYRGRMHHRDTLGTDKWIEPGAVNWLVAGHGLPHSERTADTTPTDPMPFIGIQHWVALPKDHEDKAAAFVHAPKEALPLMEGEGKTVRLILGTAYGETAPVKTASEMFYADAVLEPGASIPLPDDHEDRGVYVVSGSVALAGQTHEAGQMMVFRPGDRLSLKAGPKGARLMLLGGATLEGPRYIWWNFVASSKERIEDAKEAWRAGDWQNGRFSLPTGDAAEFIPLPDR